MNPAYPPAPWVLRGDALHSLQTVPIRVAAATVPRPLKIIPVLPGRTLGGIYAARYGLGSALEYSELVVVSALVWGLGRPGIWISHIYVDSEASLHGGREIWGLPKELAEFTWTRDSLSVRQGDVPLCSVQFRRPAAGLPVGTLVPAFGRPPAADRWFVPRVRSRVALAACTWEIPVESPFALLTPGGRKLTLFHRSLESQVPGPGSR